MIFGRNYIPVAILGFCIIAGSILCGCSGHKQVAAEEDDFFVPIDTLSIKPENKGKNAVESGSVDIQEGTQKAAGTDDFAAPLTNENILIKENLTPEQMRDSMDIISDQVAYLQTILEASTIDPKMYYHAQVKSWTINNPVLRDSLFYALLAIDSSMQSEAGADAQILATETDDLIEARFGTSVFKGLTLKQAIEKSGDRFLAQKIIESGGYSKDVELRDTNFTLPTPFQPEFLSHTQFAEKFLISSPKLRGDAEISLYDGRFRLGPNWGVAFKLGNDDIGLPFWSSGNIALMATYKQIKVGLQLPLSFGSIHGDNFPLFAIRNQLLNGTRGIAGEADFGSIGGSFFSSRLKESDVARYSDPQHVYYISGQLQAYYSFGFSLNNQNFVRLKLGGGYEQVKEAAFLPVDSTTTALTDIVASTVSSYYLKFDYIHDIPTERFGASVQLYDLDLLATAWLDILPRLLQVELKYSKIIARVPRPWENPDFIMVSPKLYLSF